MGNGHGRLALEDDVVRVERLPGVRVFEVLDSGEPLDVTDSRYEPRAVRDARERATADSTGSPQGSGEPD